MSLKKVSQAREHRERSQPAARSKLGLLEKKKDYVLRAKDFHKKENRMKALRQKASQKNPDEFYFGMIKSKTTGGIHRVSSKPELPVDVLKLMKTQDLHYISMLKHMNERKLEGLKSVLPQSLANKEDKPAHLVFAEDEDERDAILSTVEPGNQDNEEKEKEDTEVASVKSSALKEYEIRKQRIATLSLAERKLQTQKHLMQPGKRRIVGQDEYEQPIFKWRAQRKK